MKLERMTFEHISELLGKNYKEKVKYIGFGRIKNHRRDNILQILPLDHKMEVDKCSSKLRLSNRDFLSSLNEALKQKKMYISELEYSSLDIVTSTIYELEGRFYKEK